MRNSLRRRHGYPKASDAAGKPRKRIPKMGVRTIWFDQIAQLPGIWQAGAPAAEAGPAVGEAPSPAIGPQGLSCAGYGSAVTVTAVLGMAAATAAIHWLLAIGRESCRERVC